MPVAEKTAIITGAGSKRGIGRATAHALAAAGWNVAILDIDEPSAKEAAHEVAERQQAQTVGIGCDVTDEASVEAALAALDGSMPPIAALINNAGITSPTRFLEVTSEEWDRIFAVNVRGSYNISRRVAPGMVERSFGRIVFLSSVSAERAAGYSVQWRTRRRRQRSSGLPGRWPESWDRTESRSTLSPPASSNRHQRWCAYRRT